MLSKNMPPEGTEYPSSPQMNYYVSNNIQAIDIIKDLGLDFFDGNVVKYVWRLGKKEDTKKEVQKCSYYLNNRQDIMYTPENLNLVKAKIELAFDRETLKKEFLIDFLDIICQGVFYNSPELMTTLKYRLNELGLTY